MIKAAVISWPNVLRTPLVSSMVDLCYEFDIELQKIELTQNVLTVEDKMYFAKFRNVIA
jgi:hypothetical protein